LPILEGTRTEQLDEPIKEVSSKEEGDEQCSPKSDLPGTKENVQEIKRKVIERPSRMKSTRIRTIPAKYKD
jgi:hypothetical protein